VLGELLTEVVAGGEAFDGLGEQDERQAYDEVEDGGGGKDFDHGSGIEPDLKVFVHEGKG